MNSEQLAYDNWVTTDPREAEELESNLFDKEVDRLIEEATFNMSVRGRSESLNITLIDVWQSMLDASHPPGS